MFNLYYLNYTKAFEIAMQIDNKVLEKQIKEKSSEGSADLGASGEAPEINLLSKILPKLNADISIHGSKATRAEDTLKVVSTKSTILNPVIQKSVEVRKLGAEQVGKLLKIRDVSLKIANQQDISGTKILLSGLLKDIPVEGLGQMDFGALLNVFLKDASYIITGKLPEKVNKDKRDGENTTDRLLLKIPMQMEQEMENSYSISDLEIGPVTLIGIYRGIFKYKDIRKKIDIISQMQTEKEPVDIDVEIDEGRDNVDELLAELGPNDSVHYIDVIAIIQELF
ncbi:hypothetical protein SAMN04487831_11733 [Pseudobutyrivibrio sp. UC1225]|uniref:hypothetical protein n=1 Tax=Pseudobutyrivibrio sp. UC1225 TaxID=1798185 RepID=UPI0008ED1CE4|nr:hypothetical protein [Pseudobutyrivibrio sp. UC1225]SFO29727.1 hypothetical protein SAMN04487831_11733 [Pseudobutyrivibrio sp. UC1225]